MTAMHFPERLFAPGCARVRLLWAVLCGVLLLAMPAVRAQQAGSVDPSFGASLGLSGNVKDAIVQLDGKILVVGSFPKGLARLNADGTVDTGFDLGAGASAPASTVTVQADGKVLIGGYYTSAAGVTRNPVARFNADGSLDASFDPGTWSSFSSVYALAVQADGKVVVGGKFNSIGGVARNGFARLNADGSLDTGFVNSGVETNSNVYAVAVQTDGKVLIGGKFNSVGGVTRHNIARLNADGSLDTGYNPDTGVDYGVNALTVQADGKVLIGGPFKSVGGKVRNGLARLNIDGSVDTGFNPGVAVNSQIYAVVAQADGKVVISLQFSNTGGKLLNSVFRLNTDGSLDAGFDSGTEANIDIKNVAVQADGEVVISGFFTSVDGVVSNSIARLNTDGSLDRTFQADIVEGPNRSVVTLAVQSDGKVAIGGLFTSVDGVARSGVAQLNIDGSVDIGFDPNVGGSLGGDPPSIYAMAVQADGKMVIGGVFTSVDGLARKNIARLNADGSVDAGFDPGAGADSIVYAVAVQSDGGVLLGGSFSTVGGLARKNIARLNADGSVDTGFNPGAGANNCVDAIAVQPDGKVLIGGFFTTVGGLAHNHIARLNADGSVDTGFDSGAGANSVYAIAVQPDGKVLVGGDFVNVGGTFRNRIARLNADGSVDTGFNPGAGASGRVGAIVVQLDGKVLIGGFFTTVGGVARANVARLNADGSVDTGFNPGAGASSYLNAVAVQADGKVLVGGTFNSVGGVVRNYVARLNSDGSVDPDFVSGGLPRIEAIVLQSDDNMVVVGGIFASVGGGPANALARLRADGSLDPSFVAPFSIGDQVPALARQPSDGKLLISHVPLSQTKIKNPIIRCNGTNGSLDASFSANAGTNGTAFTLAVQTDTANAGKIVVGGSFTQLNSTNGRTNLGRLNANGTLDASFTAITNGTVQAMIAQTDGSLVVGGIFTTVNGVAHARIARLSANGVLDAGFTTSIQSGQVAALKQQKNGLLVVGGNFTITANGATRSGLARLNTDGSLDASFNAGAITLSGGTPLVSSIDQQPDGKLVVVGSFDHVGGVARSNVVRLTTTGSVDTTYNPGTGTDAPALAVALQPDGKTLLGGDFTTVDGLGRAGVARLFGDYNLDDYPPLGQWRIINFNQPANTGSAADTATPFGDGVPNLVKYALNLNPQAADATPMTATGTKGLPLLGKDGSGRYLTLTFVRRQAGTSPGVSYLVEFSGSLVNPAGFAVNASATSKATTLDAIWERVTVTDSVTISSQPLGRFARLRATDP